MNPKKGCFRAAQDMCHRMRDVCLFLADKQEAAFRLQ